MPSAPPTTDPRTSHDDEPTIGGWGWWAIGGALGTALAIAAAFVVLMSVTGTPDYVPLPGAPGIAALPEDVPTAAAAGEALAGDLGCLACHSVDGAEGVGPTWFGIWGEEVPLQGGGTALVDAAYVSRSILDPGAEIVAGFGATMPTFDLDDEDLGRLAAYVSTLAGQK